MNAEVRSLLSCVIVTCGSLSGHAPPLAYLFENVRNYAMDAVEESSTADTPIGTVECHAISPDSCCQGRFVLCECCRKKCVCCVHC